MDKNPVPMPERGEDVMEVPNYVSWVNKIAPIAGQFDVDTRLYNSEMAGELAKRAGAIEKPRPKKKDLAWHGRAGGPRQRASNLSVNEWLQIVNPHLVVLEALDREIERFEGLLAAVRAERNEPAERSESHLAARFRETCRTSLFEKMNG